jgi:hypothetical protein
VTTTLLSAEGRLGPSHEKTHIAHCFLVEKPLERMEIAFSYTPKALADEDRARELIVEGARRYDGEEAGTMAADWRSSLPLHNFLVVSLDDPERFRGCAHRQPPVQRHVITASDASPGFLPGPLPAGRWKVTVSAHSVVTDACDYRIDVVGHRA